MREKVDISRPANPGGPFEGTVADGSQGGNHAASRVPAYGNAFNGSLGGAHAAGQPGAFEGRAGGGGAGDQTAAVDEHDLAVGADIDKKRGPRGVGKAGGENPRRNVGADVGGQAGQRVDGHFPQAVQTERSRGSHPLFQEMRRERGDAHGGRIDAEEEMEHRGIPRDRHASHPLRRNARLRTGLPRQRPEGFAADCRLKPGNHAGVVAT